MSRRSPRSSIVDRIASCQNCALRPFSFGPTRQNGRCESMNGPCSIFIIPEPPISRGYSDRHSPPVPLARDHGEETCARRAPSNNAVSLATIARFLEPLTCFRRILILAPCIRGSLGPESYGNLTGSLQVCKGRQVLVSSRELHREFEQNSILDQHALNQVARNTKSDGGMSAVVGLRPTPRPLRG